jgi:hypothetical protein
MAPWKEKGKHTSMTKRRDVKFHVDATQQQVAGLDPVAHIIRHALPFAMWPIVAGLGIIMNLFWPSSYYALIFIVLAAAILSGLVFVLPPYGFNSTFIHGALTASGMGTLLFLIDMFGWNSFTMFMMVAAVPLICLTWSVRIAVEGNQNRGLSHIFQQAGVPGANMKIHKNED